MGKFCFWGTLINARVGKSNDVDDVIGMFGEASCNSNGNLLIELLHNCDS